jgi:PAS domain S-box-containing protein
MSKPRVPHGEGNHWHQDQWRERFRILFYQNVAGAVLTNADGVIVDCNQRFARIFGFESRDHVLTRSAWDFYFDKTERIRLIDRLRSVGKCPAEEVRLRGWNGLPVWVLTTRAVLGFRDGRPELLLGTAIDVTDPKLIEAGKQSSHEDADPASAYLEHTRNRIDVLQQKLSTLLVRASGAIQPNNLQGITRAEIRDFFLVLEEMKMIMSEIALINLPERQ